MTMQTVKRAIKGSDHEVSASATTARTTVKFTEPDINLYCATGFYYKMGDNTVTVSSSDYDRYVPAGAIVDIKTGGAGYISVILASGTDTVFICEWTSKQI